MRSPTSTSPRDQADTSSAPNERMRITPAATLSLRRLYILRVAYLVMGVGLVVTQWPLVINHDESWPLMEGVVTCMLVALSLLAFLGLRHPVKMLPILLFESAWKVIWLTGVALPLWTANQMDPATSRVASDCLWVVFVLAVIPWRYVVAQYVTKEGDRWRSDGGTSPGAGVHRRTI